MKKGKKEVTIYDLAQQLQVSPTTVSRALNDHSSISTQTTRLVKDMAKKLGYRPNTIASSLRNNKTNTIGVIMPWINRPFIASLISGIEAVATEAGYNVIISQSCDLYEKEANNAQTLYASRVDGLIASLAMETKTYDHFLAFQKRGIPVVFVDRVPQELEVDRVVIDNYAAAFKATEHLIEEGRTRIAHLAGAQHRNIYHERKRGYTAALHKHQLPVDENLISYSKLSQEEGLLSAEHLLNLPNPPDAIFAANDTAAVSTLLYAKKLGLQIPEDLAIVGFYDDYIASVVEPALTTIEHPAFEMGQMAAEQVMKHRSNPQIVSSETIVLKTKLLIRGSSCKEAYRQAVSEVFEAGEGN